MNKIPTYLIIEKKKKREDQTPDLERCIFHASVTCNVALNQYRDPFGEIPPPLIEILRVFLSGGLISCSICIVE